MKVEIWSDIMCPFCYIGKRKFEAALERFPQKDKIQVEWKSFQLMPGLQTDASVKLDRFLADEKGISLQEARAMNNYVSQMAKGTGLDYNLDRAIPANTIKAHRFAHYAKALGKQNEAKEQLFNAYFMEGENIDNIETLIELGENIGLDGKEIRIVLENNHYADEVQTDLYQAHLAGVSGVPYFVFNKKLAVSGAKEADTFLEALNKTFEEWSENNIEKKMDIIDGQSCSTDGICD